MFSAFSIIFFFGWILYPLVWLINMWDAWTGANRINAVNYTRSYSPHTQWSTRKLLSPTVQIQASKGGPVEKKRNMQSSQSSMATKGELIAELKGKTISRGVREISSHGITMENNDEAAVTGKYNANHVETTTIHFKSDGSIEWEGKAVEFTREGDTIAITGKGKAKPNATGASWDGEVSYMTMSKKLSWLNGAKGWVEGTGNMQTGEFQAKIYAKK